MGSWPRPRCAAQSSMATGVADSPRMGRPGRGAVITPKPCTRGRGSPARPDRVQRAGRVAGHRPARCARRLLGHELHQARGLARRPHSSAIEQARPRGSRVVLRVAVARNDRLALAAGLRPSRARFVEVRTLRPLRSAAYKQLGLASRLPRNTAASCRTGRRPRPPERLGRAGVGHARGDRARRHAVLDEGDDHALNMRDCCGVAPCRSTAARRSHRAPWVEHLVRQVLAAHADGSGVL